MGFSNFRLWNDEPLLTSICSWTIHDNLTNDLKLILAENSSAFLISSAFPNRTPHIVSIEEFLSSAEPFSEHNNIVVV